MIDAMSVASVAPLSVQDQRRENPVAVTRAKSVSIIIELESLSIRASSSWITAFSLSLSLSRYSGRTIVRRRLNKESPRLRLQPRILTHYTNVMSKSEVLTPNDRERASSIKIEIGKMFCASFKNDFMWITKFFISFALFLKFYMLVLAVMHFIEITLERFCMKITLFSGTLFKKTDKTRYWYGMISSIWSWNLIVFWK